MIDIEDVMEMNDVELVSQLMFLVGRREHETDFKETKKLLDEIKIVRREIQKRMAE